MRFYRVFSLLVVVLGSLRNSGGVIGMVLSLRMSVIMVHFGSLSVSLSMVVMVMIFFFEEMKVGVGMGLRLVLLEEGTGVSVECEPPVMAGYSASGTRHGSVPALGRSDSQNLKSKTTPPTTTAPEGLPRHLHSSEPFPTFSDFEADTSAARSHLQKP